MKKPLISLPFLLLRSSTAATSVITGLLQTFVFARILNPEQFSLFIIVGTIGFTLMLCDLGVAKILFVRLRKRHLDDIAGESIPAQTSAVVSFYTLLAVVGSCVCFAVMGATHANSVMEAMQFSLFFLFTALNLPWFALRNITIAVDEFIFFEALEVARRFTVIAATVALLFFLPLTAFLVFINLLWIIVLFLCIRRLIARSAWVSGLHRISERLVSFWRENARTLFSSATLSASEIYIYNIPFFVVPVMFGLGAPTIVLDTSFKVFRGGSVAYSAACDLLVPRQTRAFNERNAKALIRATWAAAGLCAIPATAAALILIFAGEQLFAFLLSSAAKMPPAVFPIVIVLLYANLVQMVALSLLVHTGFFREVSRIAPFIVLAMTVATAAAMVLKLSIIGYLAVYAAVYSAGALCFLILAIRVPIRIVKQQEDHGPAEQATA